MAKANTFLLLLSTCYVTLILDVVNAVSINSNEGNALINVLSSLKSTNSRKRIETTWKLKNKCEKWTGIKCDSRGHVTTINLRGKGLVGPLSDSIGQLPYLETLILGQNYFKGSIPTSIGKCKSLKYLDVNLNSMSGKLPSSLGNLKRLEDLILGYNQFTGSLPSSLGGLKSIRRMYINNNNLTGILPPSLGQLTSLYDLELSYNFITGTIPTTFSAMSSLQRLDLRNNDLYGSIPAQLAKLKLISLILGGNQLSGPIPNVFGTIYTLQVMSLRGNYFTGTIPKSVNNLPHLSGRSFGINCLKYPSGWKGSDDKQRPAEKCKSFCYANLATGPCGGKGACFLNSKGSASCICNSGFTRSRSNPKSCVAASVTGATKTSSSVA